MGNIFEIQQNLLAIFATIEENEGEITPELEQALSINQDELKEKIKNYALVVKELESDNLLIKSEIARLTDRKKSKEKIIERLKKIMTQAISNFGDTSKSGAKFVDYGTGKVSLRKSDSIEFDEDSMKIFSNKFIAYFNWLRYTNTNGQEEVTVQDVMQYCNSSTGELDGGDSREVNFTEEDFNKLNGTLNLDISFNDIISKPEGINLIKSILAYTNIVKITPFADKKSIKDELKENGTIPTFATYNVKQNVIIK